MYKHIIVAVDFSEAGERAIETAAVLGAKLGATVRLVHVISNREIGNSMKEEFGPLRTGVEHKLKMLGAVLLARFGTDAHPAFAIDWGVVDGSPAEELVSFAESWKGDLLVTGTKGAHGVSRALLGSVAERIMRMSKVPVLLVGPEA